VAAGVTVHWTSDVVIFASFTGKELHKLPGNGLLSSAAISLLMRQERA
jgi:hypothetical protein